MAISGVSSGVTQANFSNSPQQGANNFKSLLTKLQSSDPATAQQALADLQQAQQNFPKRAASTSGTSQAGESQNPRAADFQALQAAIASGDLPAAQDAAAKLQQDQADQKQVGGEHHGHHHHHQGNTVGPVDAKAAAADPASASLTVGTGTPSIDTQA